MSLSNSVASSPFNAEALAAATALRRPSLVLSVGSFHSAQLRRPSFFAPFPYGQSPQQFDALQDYSSSPSRRGGSGSGDVYQRDLEANYCSNFSCCGITLGDLHALLQHYEESHVRFEEEDDNGHPVPAGFADDDGWSTSSESAPNSPRPHGRQPNHLKGSSSSTLSANAAAAATVAALTASQHHHHLLQQHQQQQQQQQQDLKLTPLSFLNFKKKANGVSLSDIYAEDTEFPTTEDTMASASAFSNSLLRTAVQAEFSSLANKKRDLSAYSTSFDTHSPMAKKSSNFQNMTLSSATATFNPQTGIATPGASSSSASASASSASSSSRNGPQENGSAKSSTSTAMAAGGQSQEDLLGSVTDYLQLAMKQGLLPDCGEVGSPAYLQAAEDLIKKREELVSIMESIGKSGTSSAEKPYRCQVSGCDKAYKNPNGLKYHNQHGHCSASGLADSEGPESKPYMCTFMDCGKRYKNLNGLKYHIEHSHPNLTAALRAHQAGLTSHPLLINGVFANNQAAALAITAALSAVETSPMMMAAINAITASAANNSNNNNNNNNNNTVKNNGNNSRTSNLSNRLSPPSDHTPDSSPSPTLKSTAASAVPSAPTIMTGNINLSAYRGGDGNVFSTDVTPMTSPVLGRATLPGLSPLSIKTSLGGIATPSSLSPTLSSAAPKSPTSISQVSTLTAALAAVTVEQQRQQQQRTVM
ncbi:Transcriptional regulator of ribosomal biogenesis protein [Dissophora globulifera]|nr:Transcriptional regulator of ribosomal biogenesis protein [Dissophora globulifera]